MPRLARMRVGALLWVVLATAGCTGNEDPHRPDGPDAPGEIDDPYVAGEEQWVDLAAGLSYNGTGPTALVAEIRLVAEMACDLKIAVEYNGTGTGVQSMNQFRQESGEGGFTGSYNRNAHAVQAGPLDTRPSGTAGRPGASEGGYGIDGSGSLFVGIANAQASAEIDWVPNGTVLVTSTCPGASARWLFVGIDPVFFTPETADGVLFVSAYPQPPGAIIAGERGFDHALDTPGAMLVANVGSGAAGVLELSSPGGTETWDLANTPRIWHEGPGGQQSLSLTQAGPGFLSGALFGVPA